MSDPNGRGREYPPAEWTLDGVAEALRLANGSPPLRPLREEATWDRLRTDEAVGQAVTNSIETAEDVRDEPIPDLRASQYLEFDRTGDRTAYQEPVFERNSRLTALTIAECAERDGRFLDDVIDYVWDVCEDTTWVLPAHLWDEGELPEVPVGPEKQVTLWRATTGLALAEVDYLLGDDLPGTVRRRVRHEVERRLLEPYEERDEFRWLSRPSNNWSAVCHNGVVQAAMYLLDDPDRIADIVVEATTLLEWYLEGFGADGATAEGVGYWNYGFGHYVQLADHLESRTEGEYSLLSPPIVDRIARFPQRAELSPGKFPPFSDADEDSRVEPYIAGYLGGRLDSPALSARARSSFDPDNLGSLSEAARTLLWTPAGPSDADVDVEPEPCSYFSDVQWWVARADPDEPDGLVVAAKGGHNAESHNHNDCGSFVVHYRGESLLTDLGAPTYDRDFFGDARYEYLSARSLGHSVPYVNGYEQCEGRRHAADVVDRDSTDRIEELTLDLAECYPDEAGLESLRRAVRLDREGDPIVRLEDAATFRDDIARPSFESVLVSELEIEVADGSLVVRGQHGRAKVTPENDAVELTVEHLPDAVTASDGDRDVWRARIKPPVGYSDATTASVGLSIDFEPDS